MLAATRLLRRRQYLGRARLAGGRARDGRWANRSLLIAPTATSSARYDKIHMFDVDLASGESWRESNAYAPGEQVVAAETPLGRLG